MAQREAHDHVYVTVDNGTAAAESTENPDGTSARVPSDQGSTTLPTLPQGNRERAGDETTTAMNVKPSCDASVAVSVETSSQEAQKTATAAVAANGRTASSPQSDGAKSITPTLTTALPQVFRDPSGSVAWGVGQADASKALKSLSTCPSNLSRKGSAALGHEKLFSTGLFTPEDWKEHTSYRRWLPEPLYLFRVLSALLMPMVYVLAGCTAAAIYEEVIRKDQSNWGSLHVLDATFAYNLCSFALSLLLIFKTNSSYSRFWEARSAWASLHNDCRTFIIKMQAHATPECPLPLRKAFMRWTIALPYIMRAHLLDHGEGTDVLNDLLTSEEADWLRRPVDCLHAHQPMRAAGVLMTLVKKLKLAPPTDVDAQNLLKSYLSHCTTCEKLTVTPIPMPYTRHTVRFIIVYTSLMPIVLWGNLRWGTFIVAPIITFVLAGIETVGIYIENPLTILPMASYCRSIHRDVLLSAHDWAAADGKGTAVHVERFLSGHAPEWQQEPNAQLQQLAAQNCVDDIDGDWGTSHHQHASKAILRKRV